MITNSTFKEAVIANADETFENCSFVSGTVAKQANVFALTAAGSANVTVKNCEFANKGYSAIYMNTTGTVDIENNHFDCTGTKNPIEGGSGTNTAKLNNVTVKGNTLEGICGNNYFNFYHMADGAVINIEDNTIVNMSQQSEVVRLSNLENATATFNIKNIKYSYDMSTEYDKDWTKFLLCQDYTGNKGQDFSKFTLNIENITCNDTKVTDKDKFPVGGLYVVYDNNASGSGSAGVISDNDPVINFK